ncbi:MAG TPA: PaaI family thioesterase [Pseudonocardia sp.]|nr:PaaI family thioesterase [Pseudonocardia sp.]
MPEGGTQDGFGKYLGFTIDHASGDSVRGSISVSPDHHQGHGIVHGGVYCSVVEHAASVAAATWFADRGHVVGVTNTTHFIRAVRSGLLRVEATPLQRGRTQQLWQVFITDEQERLVAKGEVRLANIADAARLG